MDRVRETKQNKKTSNCRKQMRGYKVGLSGMKTSESTGRARRVKEMCCQDVGQDTVFVMCHCFQNHRPLSTIDENLHTPIWVLVSRSFNKDKKIKIKSQRERDMMWNVVPDGSRSWWLKRRPEKKLQPGIPICPPISHLPSFFTLLSSLSNFSSRSHWLWFSGLTR